MNDGIVWLISILIFVVPFLIAVFIHSASSTTPKITEEEKKQIEEQFISEIKNSVEFIENDYFEEMVFRKPKDCRIEVLTYRNIKRGKEVIYEPGNDILSILYWGYGISRIRNISFEKKCLVKWAAHICKDDVSKVKDGTFLGCVYIGENNIDRYYEEKEYEKARKKVMDKYKKKELEKQALLDLIEEGAIFEEKEDIELQHLIQLEKKKDKRNLNL